MSRERYPRRDFLKSAAAATGAALALPGVVRAGTSTRRGAPRRNPADVLKLGIASYSVRNFSRAEGIEMIKATGVSWVCIKSFHLPYEASPAELRAGAEEFRNAGLQIAGGGVIYFEEDSDAEVRKYFEYAKNAGMPMMTVSGPPEIWPRVERFVKEYDIRIAIHNHGPEDQRYPTPYEAFEHVRNRDQRMGVCVDIGHTARTGIDVVKAIADVGPRLIDMHIKDLAHLQGHSDVPMGEGVLPLADIFRQLLDMNYQGHINLEYEATPDDPLPGMLKSIAYVRGLVTGLMHGA